MQTRTKQAISFYILYALTTSFYINRILTRYIFENANKYSWLIICGIALFIFILSPLIYRILYHIQAKKIHYTQHKTKFASFFLYLYLFLNMFLTLIFLLTLINASWLIETRYIWILLPFLGIAYYVLKQKDDVFLRICSLFAIPVFVQYLIFIFAGNKSIDLYALIPYDSTILKPSIILLIAVQMILHCFNGIFYFDQSNQPISKKGFYLSIFFIIFSLIFDAIVVCGQFGNSIASFPFVYYESWCLISFGQYLGYLDILAFFYWVLSAFCSIGSCLWIIKKNYSAKLYNASYLFLGIVLVFVLTHGSIYHIIKPFILIASTITLALAIFTYLRKVV